MNLHPYEQVDMVVHETPGEEMAVSVFSLFGKSPDVFLSVLVVLEYGASSRAPGGDVIYIGF
jgi:hypothetical protein